MQADSSKQVYEETGYDITDKLIEELVIKLTIKEQQITLYVIPDVPEDTAFQTRTRKEISVSVFDDSPEKVTDESEQKIDWFKLLDLPTWKRNRAQANGRFYLISPFVGYVTHVSKQSSTVR
jgi:mRNA-decapping enzyme subunit 2